MNDEPVLRLAAKLLIPFILLFALYVQFHGDFGPGGGFQAGVIFATGFIVHGLVFGAAATRRVLPSWLRRLLVAAGVLVYAGTGVLGVLLGGDFLDYSVFTDTPLHGQHLGILLVEFGVGMTVFSAMVTIFLAFAALAPPERS